MLNTKNILETIRMIDDENLDIRTITMGISLLSCADSDIEASCEKIYEKITRKAEKLVITGEEIERTYGIPIINKRISVTPVAMLLAASGGDPVKYAKVLDRSWSRVPQVVMIRSIMPFLTMSTMTPRVPVAMMQAGKDRILRQPSFWIMLAAMSVASASFWAVNPPALPMAIIISLTVIPFFTLMSSTAMRSIFLDAMIIH